MQCLVFREEVNMADNEAKARQKLEEAEKKAKKTSGFFSSLLGGGGGVNDACDLFVQVSLQKGWQIWEENKILFLKFESYIKLQNEFRHEISMLL